jgi:transcriptional antiterminator NusG
MSNPTDETPEPNAAPDPAPGETSLGVSNVFEVEEQAPDGGPAAVDRGRRAADPVVPVDEAEPDDEAEDIQDIDEPPPPAVATLDDDDEPPPELVWYVLKVQSGREDTIRDALERRIKIQNLQRFFGRIVVPTEKITEIRNNKKRVVERKSYPGYIMIEMELNEKTWFVVRETPGVGDFVGAHGTPTKMTEAEVQQMLGHETTKDEKPAPVRIDVERGDRVKIKDGPFENFEGTVEEVIEQRGLVKVMLIIFNRPTPVDLEYWQVERI